MQAVVKASDRMWQSINSVSFWKYTFAHITPSQVFAVYILSASSLVESTSWHKPNRPSEALRVAPYTDNDIFYCAFSSVHISTVPVLQIVCDKHELPCKKAHHIPPNPDPVSLLNLSRSPHSLK